MFDNVLHTPAGSGVFIIIFNWFGYCLLILPLPLNMQLPLVTIKLLEQCAEWPILSGKKVDVTHIVIISDVSQKFQLICKNGHSQKRNQWDEIV